MKSAIILSIAALGAVANAQASVYGQCGGSGWSGETTCASGSSCTKFNEWYSQCVPGAASSDDEPTTPEPTVPDEEEEEEETTTPEPVESETPVEEPVEEEEEPVEEPTTPEPIETETPVEEPAEEEEPVEEPAATSAAPAAPTAAPPSSGGSTGLQTSLPEAQGEELSAEAILVTDSLDGGMKLYDRSTKVCQDQSETGEKDAMFILEDGASLSNVIIGANQAEGVHCRGTCTLTNVWFKDVCEDAITLKQTGGTSKIIGGGAFAASDKVVQFNGLGTVEITDFYAENYGKLVRSCGNCKNNAGSRHIVIAGSQAVNGGVLCGINSNLGDTCSIVDTCQAEGKSCDLYEGNNTGKEPKKISSGPDGTSCTATGFTETC